MVRMYCQVGGPVSKGANILMSKKTGKACLLSLSLFLSASVFSNVFAEQASHPIQLRGSTTSLSVDDATGLRGGISTPSPVQFQEQPIVDESETSFLDDMGSALFYLRDNIAPVVLFSGINKCCL